MKKDLSEISHVVQSESQSLIQSSVLTSGLTAVTNTAVTTANYLKETVNALVDDEEEVEPLKDGTTEETDEEKAKRLEDRELAFDADVKQMLHIPESLAIAASHKLSSVFTTLIDVIAPPANYDDDDVVILPDGQTIACDRWNLLVKAIQSDPRTYCHEPDGVPEDYENWLEKFNLMDQDVNKILSTCPEVKEFHEKLVPNDLSEDMFWHRYFYRIENLKQQESKRAKMLQERKLQQQQASPIMSPGGPGGREDVTITNLKEEGNNSSGNNSNSNSKAGCVTPATPEGKSSGATSDEWEKTSMTDIVDEAAKKLADRLNIMPEPRSDEELNEWEFE